MKKLHLICIFIIFSLAFQSVYAQRADLPIRGQRGYTPPFKFSNKTILEPKEVVDEVNAILPVCVTEFNLDDFEKEILKNMLTNKFESENSILKDTKVNRDDRRKKYIEIDKRFYLELTSILTSEEREIFKLMDFTDSVKEQRKEKQLRFCLSLYQHCLNS